MLLMLKVLMSLGFVAFDYLFPNKACRWARQGGLCDKYPAPLCHLHLAPSLHQTHFHSLPAPLPCRLQAPAWLEIGQSGL